MTAETDFLTDRALNLLRRPDTADELREQYETVGIVQLEDFARADRLADLGKRLYEGAAPLAERTVKDHEILQVARRSVVSSGYRFWRVDPNFAGSASEKRDALKVLFSRVGLTQLGLEFGERAASLVRYFSRKELSYDNVFCFLYEEGDYIGMHNDAPSGERVNLQFPISLDSTAGFRALHEGRLRLYPDTPGCLRIIGPRVWHEVLPVQPTSRERPPHRVLISFRFK